MEKEEQIKLKVNKRKEVAKIKAETNETQKTKIIET